MLESVQLVSAEVREVGNYLARSLCIQVLKHPPLLQSGPCERLSCFAVYFYNSLGSNHLCKGGFNEKD